LLSQDYSELVERPPYLPVGKHGALQLYVGALQLSSAGTGRTTMKTATPVADWRANASCSIYGCVVQDELSKIRECRRQTDEQLSEVRSLYGEKQKSLSGERKRGAELRAELENINLRLFYLENAKNDVRSDIAVMKRAAEKAESEVLKKEDSKRVQDLYVNRLVERIDRLREDIALFDAQLEAQTAETRAARELLGEARMEIEAITVEKKHLYSAWNSALVGMRRRDEAHAAMSEALREQQQRLLTLEAEMDGIRRMIQKEQLENEKLMASLYRTEGELATVKRMLTTSQVLVTALTLLLLPPLRRLCFSFSLFVCQHDYKIVTDYCS